MKQTAADVTEQKEEEDLVNYGDEGPGGSMESEVRDIDETVKDTIGNLPVPGEPFFIADETDKDEKDQNFDEDAEAKEEERKKKQDSV